VFKLSQITLSTTGGAKEGIKYRWISSDGKKWEVRIHSPDSRAPMGSNARSRWVVRVQRGREYMDHNGIFYGDNVSNRNSPSYSPQTINDTHIPMKTPDFFDLFK
jgi:hypothetical protein